MNVADLDAAFERAVELDDARDDREPRRALEDDHVGALLVRDDPRRFTVSGRDEV